MNLSERENCVFENENKSLSSDQFCVDENEEMNDSFQLIWRHLKYTVYNSKVDRFVQRMQGFHNTPEWKEILHNISGNIRSGQLMAFMGPSGSGKSTLLECVVDKRVRGKGGDVIIAGDELKNITISFVAQKNNFSPQFTVRETILFAAKLQIATKVKQGTIEHLYDDDGHQIAVRAGSSQYCSIVTDRVIATLGLNECANNRIPSCSGGQLKRVAIAQELVAKPRILVLDEPTSGLDSTSCYQLIEVLQSLTQQKPGMAVLATIHQPSFKVLKLFHKVYVISLNGDCILEDKPENLVNILSDHNLQCPTNCNPADFVMQVAYEEHGTGIVEQLVSEHRKSYDDQFEMPTNSVKLLTLKSHKSFPTLKHIFILFQRYNLQTLRDSLIFLVRLGSTILVPFFLTSLFGTQIGVRGGCPPKFDSNFEPSQLKQIGSEIRAELETTFINCGNIFFATLFLMFNPVMVTLLTFPTEMIVFKAEKANSWYGVAAFYFGKLFSEIPQHFICLVLYWPLVHLLQNQIREWWRFRAIVAVLLFQLFISQTIGHIIGAICMYNIPASVFLGPSIVIVPLFLLCGLLIKVKSFSPFFLNLSYFNYLRFIVEAVFVALYGFDRCDQNGQSSLVAGREAFIVWFSAMLGIYKEDTTTTSLTSSFNVTISSGGEAPSERFVTELIDAIAGHFISDKKEVRSSVMNTFAFEDSFLERGLIASAIYLCIVRLIAYFVISFKVRVKD
ncbi:ABC transporter-like protein 12 [Leptotrombidium deliense]|uniref:ABC transporter-like protein 12 n=1 Tax=Leptotrombidium deliense TaxID=299467 RepID=A0A443SP07_9ACAR|nr:ABC transporter-like protein 12 [Leptotrombidium deliense]